MFLKKYLLLLAGGDVDTNTKLKCFAKVFDYLLKNSQSVAITSVLASVAIAYQDFIGESVFPLFRVKEFFSRDISRIVARNMELPGR